MVPLPYVLCVLLVLYFTFDKQAIHYSRTARLIFWAIISCCLILLLVPSLARLVNNATYILVSGVLLTSLVENVIQEKVKLKPFTSTGISAVKGTPEAEGKVLLVEDAVSKINKGRGVTVGVKQALAMLNGGLRSHQHAIHEVFASSDPDDLNYVLLHVNCPQMLEVCGNGLVELLASWQGRLPDIHVLARAAVIDGLQKLGIRHRPKRQNWAASIVLNTFGEDLTLLKCFLDESEGSHNTQTLLYRDLQFGFQKAVMNHIEMEGLKLRDRNDFYGKFGTVLKIVSDFDDTMVCSGAQPKFAGCDSRLPPRTMYPGVLSLFRELDTCFHRKVEGQKHTPPKSGGDSEGGGGVQPGSNFVLLSARPKSYKGWSEIAFFRKVCRPLLRSGKLHSCPVLLMGSMDVVPRAIFKYFFGRSLVPAWKSLHATVFQMLALRKILGFEEYMACYPEASFICFGDNGQGDVLFVETIMQNPQFADKLLTSFIQLVRPLDGTLSRSCTPKSCSLDNFGDGDGISFHKSHVAMAKKAHSMGLLDDESLQRVLSYALVDFRVVRARHASHEEKWVKYWIDFKRDFLEASRALPKALQLEKEIQKLEL